MTENASRPGFVALPITIANQNQGSKLMDHLFTMIGLVPRSALFCNHDIIQFNPNAVLSQNQPPMPTIQSAYMPDNKLLGLNMHI